MKHEISYIMDDAMKNGVWNEILSPETDLIVADLLKLSTDYSCQGCAF